MEVTIGDIALQEADVIVSAANSDLLPENGVAAGLAKVSGLEY